MSDEGTHGQVPTLRILDPDATPEEIAALVAVFAAIGGSTEQPAAPAASAWSQPSRQVRATHRHGVGAWRASSLPR